MRKLIFKNGFLVLIIIILNHILNFFLHKSTLDFSSVVIVKSILIVLTYLFLVSKKLKIDFRPNLFRILTIVFAVSFSFYAVNTVFDTVQNTGVKIEINTLIVFFFSCIFIGLFEELFFRVFIFKLFLNENQNKLRSALLTSIIFALAHLANLFNEEVVHISVLVQVTFAFGLGYFFQSLYIKFNNLLLVTFLHGLTNYFSMYKSHFMREENPVNTIG